MSDGGGGLCFRRLGVSLAGGSGEVVVEESAAGKFFDDDGSVPSTL